jgi:hypothetical protein
VPTFGEPALEKLSSEALALLVSCKPLQHADHYAKGERFQLATCLALISSIFVALHEVGHVVRCHPSYLQERYGVSVFEELPMVQGRRAYHDVALAFEWEADEYAAITSYQLTHHLFNAGNFRVLRAIGVDFAWGLAVSMVFFLIARLSGKWSLGSKTHPSALNRYVWSMISIQASAECAALNPRGDAFRAGFDEAKNWFYRHEVRITGEAESLTVEDALRGLQEECAHVRGILSNESELLERLDKERSEGAARWHAQMKLSSPRGG